MSFYYTVFIKKGSVGDDKQAINHSVFQLHVGFFSFILDLMIHSREMNLISVVLDT